MLHVKSKNHSAWFFQLKYMWDYVATEMLLFVKISFIKFNYKKGIQLNTYYGSM